MAEFALIAQIILKPENFQLVDGQVFGDDFYVPANAAVFEAVADMCRRKVNIWPASVVEAMANTQFKFENPKQTIAEIMECGHAGDISGAVWILKNFKQRRLMMVYAKAMTDAAAKGDEKVMLEAQRKLAECSVGFSTKRPDDPLEQLTEALKQAQEPERMLQTGLRAWDEAFGGMARGARYIIAGKGGAGKTALALNILWNVAKQGKKARHIFFEGSESEVWHRIMARETRTPITSFRKGLTEYQTAHVIRQQDKLINRNLAVVKDPRNVGEMIERCGQCDVIVLDGISSAPSEGATNIMEHVQFVTRSCKTLADRTGATVIMLAHLNSEGVKNAGSGTGIYGGQAATFDPEGIVELAVDESTKEAKIKTIVGHITKNRYGGNGLIRFQFDGEYMDCYDGV